MNNKPMTAADHQIAHLIGMAQRTCGPTIFNARKRMGTEVRAIDPIPRDRDRSLSGKARIKARKEKP